MENENPYIFNEDATIAKPIFVWKKSIITKLSRHMFWDVYIQELDIKKNKNLIIERIALYGNDNDIRIMFLLYSKGDIKKALINSDSLNQITIEYFSLVLGVKKEAFKCYGKKPAHQM